MFMWLIKQLWSIRKVLDGRQHPHQLAWGLALGFLVGVVPHGNLLALALIAVVLSLRVNHSLAALTGVAVALLAPRLDPLTHKLGQFVLADPRWHDSLVAAWQLPLMPWTDLNNTVVVGSLTLGVAMVLPLYAVSYPFFRYLQPSAAEPETATEQPLAEATTLMDATEEWGDVDAAVAAVDETDVVAETPVDVIRLETHHGELPASATDQLGSNEVQMNQALGYLLRRLRDSQQGDVA